MILWLALLAAVQQPAPPAAAPPAAAQAPTAVRIPFAPPIDRPLRYRATRTQVRDGTTTAGWIENELRFLPRTGGGFRLSVRPLALGSPGRAASPAASRMAARVTPPYVLLLDAEGTIEGLEDEDAYFNAMYTAMEEMLRMERRARGEQIDERAVQMAMNMIRQSPREAQIATLTRLISPVLEYAALGDATPGEILTGDRTVAALGSGTATQQVRITPVRVADGHLFVNSQSTLPREEAARLVRNLIAQIPVTGRGNNTAEGRARTDAQLRDMDYSDVTEASYEVSLTTGLTRRGRQERRTEVRSPRETRTMIERVELEAMD